MNNQQLAVEKLSKLKVGALFMEMGTGKTKVALDLICSKIHKVDYVLWICPYSLKNEIEAERLKWHPDLQIEVVGVETISSSDRTYLRLLKKVEKSETFIVVDESLKIKNKEAKRTQRILQLGQYAKYKLILNGTPLSKNVLDLWTQMEFLSPKILNMSYNQFKNTYCEYYIRGTLKNRVKKQHNIEHLVSKIRPYIFDSKLDINAKKTYKDYTYSMNSIEEYEGIKSNFFQMFWNNDFLKFISLATKLQKYYCDSKEKEDLITDLTNKINDKIIIFVKFLDSIPAEAVSITGDVKLKERKQIIEDFKQGKFKVLYITYGCGSFGLNLQFCKHIIFAEHTFDYAQKEQAEARIYRIGQNYDVTYYNLWCNSGLERLIRGCLEKKVRLLDEVKKEIESGGVEWLKSI